MTCKLLKLVKTNLLVYLVSNRPFPRLKEPARILGSYAILEPVKSVAIPPPSRGLRWADSCLDSYTLRYCVRRLVIAFSFILSLADGIPSGLIYPPPFFSLGRSSPFFGSFLNPLLFFLYLSSVSLLPPLFLDWI